MTLAVPRTPEKGNGNGVRGGKSKGGEQPGVEQTGAGSKHGLAPMQLLRKVKGGEQNGPEQKGQGFTPFYSFRKAKGGEQFGVDPIEADSKQGFTPVSLVRRIKGGEQIGAEPNGADKQGLTPMSTLRKAKGGEQYGAEQSRADSKQVPTPTQLSRRAKGGEQIGLEQTDADSKQISTPAAVLRKVHDGDKTAAEHTVTESMLGLAQMPLLRTPEKANGTGPGGGKHKGGEEKIYVTVRVRPLSSKELAQRDVADWDCTNIYTIAFIQPLPERSPYPSTYVFDKVFGPDCPTQRVYEEGAKDVALSAMTGLNSTIFAYGQTSSGKTFTMRGITESAVVDIFDYINKNPEREYVLKVSALEIYNEIVKDLLSAENGPLRLLDDPERGTVVEKLTEELVQDISHLRQILAICEAHRQVGETTLNDTSSRSHQIIRLTVESCPRCIVDGSISNALLASLNFVDLAGSERASQTMSEGARLKEGCHINRSLLTLSTCIRKLSGGNRMKGGHIPYRDSKLTRILQHSLGGNARTAIICTMSPAHSHVDQSRNTLFFASRAKEVTNTAHVNLVVSDKVLVKQLQKEVARLEAELRVPDAAPSVAMTSEVLLQAKELQIQQMELEMRELIHQRDAAQARLDEVLIRMREEEEAKEIERVKLEEQARQLERTRAEEQAKEIERVRAEEQAKQERLLENPSPSDSTSLRPTLGHLPSIQPVDCRDDNVDSSCALVVVRKNLCSDAFMKDEQRQLSAKKGSALRQSAASLMLVQEIRKLEHLQDEIGEDASRALLALQKEVECLRLAQAGMNHDAASTIKKLQDEIKEMHVIRTTAGRDLTGDESRARVSMSINTSLRQELVRLQAMGESDRNDASAAIATLEEQLESVQKSLDKMVLDAPESHIAVDDEKSPSKSKTATPTRKKISLPLTMSSSSRQRLMAGSPPRSPRSTRRCSENNENTPPRPVRENTSPRVGENTSPTVGQKQKTAVPGSEDCQGTLGSKDSAGNHRRTSSVDIRKMQNMFKTAAEENIKSIRSYVTELKERVAKLQYQKQLLLCQVLELEANGSEEEDTIEEEEEANEQEVAAAVPRSPSGWRQHFEEQRMLILEHWDKCNVSIVRRTQFFLLFKGDLGDAMYLNVELQHLNWLHEHCITASSEFLQNHHSSEEHMQLSPLSTRLQNLKRERELLARRMRSRFTAEEREDMFSEWGIPLDAKQRKLQLTYKIWTNPYDLAHVQASAEVVARIVGFWEPASGASKEMFELTFAPPGNARPLLFGWNPISTLLNF